MNIDFKLLDCFDHATVLYLEFFEQGSSADIVSYFWGRGYSHILAIRVCAAGKGMVFKPFSLV